MLAAVVAVLLSTPAPAPTCASLDDRIRKRRHFLWVRAREKLRLGPFAVSPYCQENPSDEDCQPLPSFQDQQDISRDVSEFVQEADAGPPETDPVLVPLLRKRTELKCPGKPPTAPLGEE